jgi:hypothetical protein
VSLQYTRDTPNLLTYKKKSNDLLFFLGQFKEAIYKVGPISNGNTFTTNSKNSHLIDHRRLQITLSKQKNIANENFMSIE